MGDTVGKPSLSAQDENAVIELLKKLLAEKAETEQKLQAAQKEDKKRQEEERWARVQRRAGTFTPEEWKLRKTYDAFHSNWGKIKMHDIPETYERNEQSGHAYCLCHSKLSPLSELIFVRPGYNGEPGFVHRDVAKKHGWVEYIVK